MQQRNTPQVAPKCPSFLTPSEWRALLSDFFQNAMDTWVAILEAERSENYNECAFYAHRLKGSAGLMGFDQLAAIADQCETILRNQPHHRQGFMELLRGALVTLSVTVAPPKNTELANAS